MADEFERLTAALSDRYRIEREIGAGGMATVYLAEDVKHHRKVAVKVLRPELAASLGRERFLNEIQTAAGLSHPHILPVHDSGEADGLLYYTMPFVDGESLHARIQREQQLPIDEALGIAGEIANALAYAHALNVVHRDIKPENILLHGGHAVIADFGIAKAFSDAGGAGLTGTGVAIGTPQYMSPEQASGDETDARSDLYALGCVTYEMLVGQPPYTGRNVASIVQQHIAAPVPLASTIRTTVSSDIAAAIQRSMAKTPADRFASAAEFSRALTGPTDGLTAWLGNALQQRVPHVLGAYAFVSVAAIALLGLLVDRLVLSPHLVPFGAVALASFLPAVGVITYSRGRSWSAKAKVAVPTNLVLSAALLLVVFGSRDLGAATTSVTVTDETGNAVERVVPKAEFRKHIGMFFFANETGDSTLDWLQYALVQGIGYDLRQDLFLNLELPSAFSQQIRRAGYRDQVRIPVTLQRQTADEEHLAHFVSGSFTGDIDQLDVTVHVYETKRGRRIHERRFTGTALHLIDTISVQLKHDLGLPRRHIEETVDLPVSEILTTSAEAFESYGRAQRAILVSEDWAAAMAHLQAAVTHDPTFAMAQVELYAVGMLSNDQATAMAGLRAAMQHIYRLPERDQFAVKMPYYQVIERKPEATLAVAEMRAELFPDDVEAYLILAQLYTARNLQAEAVAALQQVLAIDVERHDMLSQIGVLYESRGSFDSALTYFQQYADRFPEDHSSFVSLGRLSRRMGRHEEARSHYERAAMLEPEDLSAKIGLAMLESDFGRFDNTMEALARALDAATVAQDRHSLLNALASHLAWRGRVAESLEHRERAAAEAAQFMAPLMRLMSGMESLDAYASVGRESEALAYLESTRTQVPPPLDELVEVGYVELYTALEQPDSAEAAVGRLEIAMTALGLQMLEPLVLSTRGRIATMRGDYSAAVDSFRVSQEQDPSDLDAMLELGRAFHLSGDLDAAEEQLKAYLSTRPYSPRVHHELARVYRAKGDRARAIEHLDVALHVWKDADPEFQPALEARADRRALESR